MSTRRGGVSQETVLKEKKGQCHTNNPCCFVFLQPFQQQGFQQAPPMSLFDNQQQSTGWVQNGDTGGSQQRQSRSRSPFGASWGRSGMSEGMQMNQQMSRMPSSGVGASKSLLPPGWQEVNEDGSPVRGDSGSGGRSKNVDDMPPPQSFPFNQLLASLQKGFVHGGQVNHT